MNGIRPTQDVGRLFIGDQEIHRYDRVQDFRGEFRIVNGWYPPGVVARGARVELAEQFSPEHSGLFYTGVINARIVLASGEEFSS